MIKVLQSIKNFKPLTKWKNKRKSTQAAHRKGQQIRGVYGDEIAQSLVNGEQHTSGGPGY